MHLGSEGEGEMSEKMRKAERNIVQNDTQITCSMQWRVVVRVSVQVTYVTGAVLKITLVWWGKFLEGLPELDGMMHAWMHWEISALLGWRSHFLLVSVYSGHIEGYELSSVALTVLTVFADSRFLLVELGLSKRKHSSQYTFGDCCPSPFPLFFFFSTWKKFSLHPRTALCRHLFCYHMNFLFNF